MSRTSFQTVAGLSCAGLLAAGTLNVAIAKDILGIADLTNAAEVGATTLDSGLGTSGSTLQPMDSGAESLVVGFASDTDTDDCDTDTDSVEGDADADADSDSDADADFDADGRSDTDAGVDGSTAGGISGESGGGPCSTGSAPGSVFLLVTALFYRRRRA